MCNIYARMYNHVNAEPFPFAKDMSIVLLYLSAISNSLNVFYVAKSQNVPVSIVQHIF